MCAVPPEVAQPALYVTLPADGVSSHIAVNTLPLVSAVDVPNVGVTWVPLGTVPRHSES